MTRFIAIDGEGMDTDRCNRIHTTTDGQEYTSKEHIYTLLAASNNTLIEDWEDGLHTQECLDYLLSLAGGSSVLVGFSFGYDSNMIMRDLTPEQLTILWEAGRVDVKFKTSTYRIRYLPGKWFSVSLMFLNRKNQWRPRKTAKVWDVFGFYQHSFVKSLEEWFVDDPHCGEDVLNMIAAMKERRGSFKQDDRKETIMYCLEECRLLKLMMEKLNAALEDADIFLRSWHGAGAISGYLMEKNRVGQHVRWDELPEDAQNASLWAYFGGRVEIFQQGLIPGDMYEYDKVSAYPSTIVELPSLKYSGWYECEGSDLIIYDDDLQYSLWYVEWDTSNSDYDWLAPFPQRGTDESIYWVTSGKGWYHGVEVREAKRIFGSAIRIIRGIYMIPDAECNIVPPFAWLYDLMLSRVEDKKQGRPRHIPKKLGGNSIYGKLAQGISRDGTIPRYQNYYLAGLVTATTRADMLRAASYFDYDYIVSIATDGIAVRDTTHLIPTDGNFGSWELKPAKKNVFVVQAGVYLTPDGKEIRTRGFSARSVDYQMCLDAWYSASSRDTWKVPYVERRFTGLGYAASTRNWDEYRRWIDRERKLLLRTEPRKVVDEVGSPDWTQDDSRVTPFILEPGEMLVESRPYSPRRTSAEMTKAYAEMLDYFEAVEQEEYGE